MIVLTLNCGSSTVKYKLIDTTTQKNLAVGKADRVGMMGAIIDVERPGGEKIVRETELLDHAMAISAIIRLLVEPELGILKSLDEIQAIGHRVVHGGETFTGSVRITDAVVQTLKDNIQLAPLHNPPNIVGIEAAMAILPNVPMVGVFDTAFHTTMPEHAYIYPIPYALYKKYAIRRYGFHGTSHFYVARRACEILKTKASETNLITLHL
ncbi:MAG TPA: acetate kinase, partial [Acidobacteriota bacterium]|nr:acetate kinase [Acidobacteriota bacterium]